jgi:hypothetical protein
MERINPELAEIAGIHAGDGYLWYNGKRKEFDVSGGYDEIEYYNNYVVPLVNRTFGTDIKAKKFPLRNTYGFRTTNPKIIEKLKFWVFLQERKLLRSKFLKKFSITKTKT